MESKFDQRCFYAQSWKRRYRGFTIVELLVTIVIVSILATVAFPTMELAVKRSNEQELRRNLREIRRSLDEYRKASDEGHIQHAPDDSGYPPSLHVLVDGVADAASSTAQKIFFLRRIPRDPFAASTTPADQTWGLRSYESSAEDPKSGKDVFDVYSLSTDIGLNGIPYQEW